MWPNRKVVDLIGIEQPIIQAPMAGASGSEMAIAVSEAGGLGSLPCAVLDVAEIRQALDVIRRGTAKPINVNFFCHQPAAFDAALQAQWVARLSPYYKELDVAAADNARGAARKPFDEATCAAIEEFQPEVVSFHFGLPDAALMDRIKSWGGRILSSATTVEEALWLEEKGCDAIIAQGFEAGGHRGMFLTTDLSSQVGTLALVPQIVDAVNVPVIAAGGIADGRGIAAAFALGAAGVQIGTAYLFTPEALISPLYRAALHSAREDQTALTNVFSGRPARGLINRIVREVGPMSDLAPPFPNAGTALLPLKKKAEAAGETDFTSLWCGQAVRIGRESGASELTKKLALEGARQLGLLASP